MKGLKEIINLHFDSIHRITDDHQPNTEELLYIDSVLYACCQYTHGQFRAALNKDPNVFMREMLIELGITIPSEVRMCLALSFDSYTTAEHPRQCYKMYVDIIDGYVIKGRLQKLSRLYGWLLSDETMQCIKKGLKGVEASEVIKRGKPALLMSRGDRAREIDNQRVVTIVRSRVLFDMALAASKEWVSEANSQPEWGENERNGIIAYAKTFCLHSGTHYFGYNDDGKYTIRTRVFPGHAESTILQLEEFSPEKALRSRITFRTAVCNLALLDMEQGASLNAYVRKVRQVSYLVLNHYKLNCSDDYYTVRGYVGAMFPEPVDKERLVNDSLTGDRSVLKDVIAMIDRPHFEKYKDVERRGKYAFDYITVETSLIHRHGRKGLATIKSHMEEFKALIMEVVAESSKLKRTPELLDYLYVKELTAYGGGYMISTLIEFKPGLEEVINGKSGEVAPLELK